MTTFKCLKRATFSLGIVLGLLGLIGVDNKEAKTATLLLGSFRGNAFGTFANAQAGDLATTLGRSAYITCGCTGTNGVTKSNTVNSVDAGQAFKADKLYSTVFTSKSTTNATVMNTSTVSGLNVLNGGITADNVVAVADTSANTSTINSDGSRSKFTNLKIFGNTISSEVAPNTKVNLPGFGTAILEQVVREGNGRSSGAVTVNMIVVNISQVNSLDIPIGSKIIVAHAKSGYNRNQSQVVVSGEAFADSAKSESALVNNKIGKGAAIYMPCEGTNGNVLTNNINALSFPGVLTSGTGSTTAFGGPVGTETVSQLTAEVQNVNLLAGLITADEVRAFSKSQVGTAGSFSTEGSQFSRLKVLGIPYSINVSPNTRVNLPGIGYVILYERNGSASGNQAQVRVNMLHLFVTTGNTLGLPVGTEIVVASARSGARTF